MGKVDREALDEALEHLLRAGTIAAWQRRPFDMYTVTLATGETLRPTSKETAMWVQGVLYATPRQSHTSAAIPGHAVDRNRVAEQLTDLVENGLIQRWDIDRDGDYLVVHADGERSGVWAPQMGAWAAGIAFGANLTPVTGRASMVSADQAATASMLDLLVDQELLESWEVDDDGDYRLTSATAETRWIEPASITPWVGGALHTFKVSRSIDESERQSLHELFTKLRRIGMLDGWESNEVGEYRIWSSGDDTSLDVPARLALTWAMGAVEASTWLTERVPE